ncbi:MAG: hypothetical protein PHX83_06700 [Acidobacteriia bacterium]|nr:hypothetical protein [Terriglobia bacterium]
MTTKADIIAAVQAAADAYYVADPETGASVKLGIGSTGTVVTIAGQKFDSGAAWGPEPAAIPCQIEGLADYLDTLGITETAAIKAKVNEIVAQYNQLRTDYNAGTVPTTATAVIPIP